MKERLLLFIESIGITVRDFERECCMSNGYINSMRKGLGQGKLNNVLSHYPQLNREWLLFGEGEMLVSKKGEVNFGVESKTESKSESKVNSNNPGIPLLPLSAIAGTLTGFESDGICLENCERIDSPIANVDFGIRIYGESMSPEYPSGSVVLIKKVDPTLFIEWGRVYVMDTPNGVVLKEVHESDKMGFVKCHSINPDPKFADFEVPLATIRGMYRVLMCLAAK